jgi:hypothetical protein
MRRFLFSFSMAVTTTAAVVAGVSSCSSSASSLDRASPVDLDAARRDGPLVEPPEGGSPDSSSLGPEPECTAYCDSVLDSCKGSQAQYGSRDECLAFCAALPPGKVGESQGDSIACRQFYAGSPARTDSLRFCGAAGPFGGGGVCGDRCPIFCELTLSACPPEGGAAPYPSYSDCQTACVGFAYKDGSVDGGGEPTSGPSSGNTLNCRLYYVREAVMSGTSCHNLGVDSIACAN